MRKTRWAITLLLITVIISCNKVGDSNGSNNNNQKPDPEDSLIGKTLPDWQEGNLDIHAINTGRGESTFFIFPDGTTFLCDAAGSAISKTNKYPPPPQKPNENVRPDQAITHYINHYLPRDNKNLDYMLISHFHPDHMGGYKAELPDAPNGYFKMSGVRGVGEQIPVKTMIDRGYPDYDYPVDLTTTNSYVSNQMAGYVNDYIKFTNWAKEEYGTKTEQFEVGKNNQIKLKKNPGEYSNFEIRNLAVNGKVWTGEGENWKSDFPDDLGELVASNPNENIFSDVFQLSYGNFNYFSGGDIQYNDRTQYPWKDIEAPIAEVVSKVDVMKASHHGTSNTNSSALLDKLRPEVVVCQPWRDVQPNPATIERFYSANKSCKIFLTNLDSANREKLGANASRLKSTNGHIVVRVAPGGDEYSIYVLDDTDEKYKIKKVYGPYNSK